MTTVTLTPVSTGSDGNVRIAEDIIRNPFGTGIEQNSPLIKRGRVVWTGNPGNGFPGFGQHFNGPGQARSPVFYDGRSGGVLQSGIGQRVSGYGSYDDGAGGYLRLARDQLDCYWTQSGRIQLRAQEPGAVLGPTFYFDTQLPDNSKRQFPSVGYRSSGNWVINTATAASIPGSAGLVLGDNEDKQGSMYFAFSYYMAADMVSSHFGHFQIGGQIFDLRTIGAGGADEPPQVGSVPFGLGLNAGISVQTPTPDKWGGFCLDRWEVTVGDQLA